MEHFRTKTVDGSPIQCRRAQILGGAYLRHAAHQQAVSYEEAVEKVKAFSPPPRGTAAGLAIVKVECMVPYLVEGAA